MNTKVFGRIPLLFVFAVSAFILSQVFGQNVSAVAIKPYSVEKVISSAGTEYRLMYSAPDSSSAPQHFLSVIVNAGAVSIRPHPGDDLNGWGTSWYPQPFFPGAVLQGAKALKPTVRKTGITVKVTGTVSSGTKKGAGSFSVVLVFTYDSSAKKVSGTGTCVINLSKSPSALGLGDLNLYKIATNYLHDVPLLGGGTGDTGDMSEVNVVGDSFSYVWDLIANPSFFPQDITDTLSVDVVGQYNNVDTAAQGYSPIAAAYKPSVDITYASKTSGLPMIFGAIYDTAEANEFWQDNVGITPLILHTSSVKKYAFDVAFQSIATGSLVDIVASSGDNGSISPSGLVKVEISGSQTFTITPDPDCQIKDVLVDGLSVGAVTSYTFTDVNTSHTISASFLQKIASPIWEEVSPPELINKVACYGNTMYALGGSNLYRGIEDGNSWQPLGVGGTCIDIDQGIIWIGHGGYISFSEDGGATFHSSFWTADSCGGVDFENGYGWAAITSWGANSGPVQKIPGSAWKIFGYFSYQTVDVVTDRLDPSNCAYFWLLEAGGYGGTWSIRTTDDGATWKTIPYRVIFSSVSDGKPVIYSFSRFSTNRGSTWHSLGINAQTIAKGPDGLLYVGTSNKGVFAGVPNAWSGLGLKSENIVSIGVTSDKILACTNGGKVFRAVIYSETTP